MKEKYNCNLKVKCFYRLDALDFASGHQNLVCYKVNNMNNAHGVFSIAWLKLQTLKKLMVLFIPYKLLVLHIGNNRYFKKCFHDKLGFKSN